MGKQINNSWKNIDSDTRAEFYANAAKENDRNAQEFDGDSESAALSNEHVLTS